MRRRGTSRSAGTLVDVGAALDEKLDRVDVVLGGGPHQRGLAVPLLARLQIGAVLDQDLEHASIAGACRRHQNGLTLGQHRIGIRTRLEQHLASRQRCR